MNTTSRNRFNQIVRAQSARREDRIAPNIATHTPFMVARIVDWTSIAPNRWLYSWRKAELNTTEIWVETPPERRGAWEGTALNIIEGMNTSSVAGPGVGVAGLPGTYSLRPVQGYVIIFKTYAHEMGDPVWFFCVPNAIDGACTAPLTADFDYGDFIAGSYLTDDFGDFDAPTGDNDLGTFGVYDGGTFAAPDWNIDFFTFATGGSAENYTFGSYF